MTPPVKFGDKVRAAAPANGNGYPVKLSANDLDKNFYFATPEVPATNASGRANLLSDVTSTAGGFETRSFQVEIPAGSVGDILYFNGREWVGLSAPGDGIYVLGSDNGTVQWLATEDCN